MNTRINKHKSIAVVGCGYWGTIIVNNLIKTGIGSDFLVQYKNDIENLRDSLDYDIAGVVFKVTSIKIQNELGNRQ